MGISAQPDLFLYRKTLGKNDPNGFRNEGILRHLCDILRDKPHKYVKKDHFTNTLYVATETFYWIACHHPFIEGNKSTAYLCALIVIYANYINNLIANKEKFPDEISLGLEAPKEAEEIAKLAEGGEDEVKIKKLIKEFLSKYIGVPHDKKG